MGFFPQYMCSAIRKSGDRAAVTMVFPYFPGGTVVCLMSLAILASKVEYLAMELFGVHLETEDGFRCVVLENGGRLVPGQDMILQGARDEAILKLFGLEASRGIAASPAREEEVRQAILATRCVTMRVSSNPNDDVMVSLNLGLEEGFRIKETLYEDSR